MRLGKRKNAFPTSAPTRRLDVRMEESWSAVRDRIDGWWSDLLPEW